MGRQVNQRNPSRPPLPLMRDKEVTQEQPDQRALTERYTEDAVHFIQKNKEEPFFLYMAHMHVHVPIFVPEHFLKRAKNGGYGAAVEEIDWSMGVIMEKLDALGLSDNTLIIFTSDNGSRARGEGGSNGACRGHKATTWDGGIRVPCIMRWPNRIKAGQVQAEVTTSFDFFTTISNIVDVAIPADRIIDGKNILPLMTDPAAKSETKCFGYYLGDELQAVRCGEWKLHFCREKETIEDLYNLRSDIGETQNLFAQHPDIVADLVAQADLLRADIGDTARGMTGANRRPHGTVDDPKYLTTYRENHPYIIAEYDLADMPVLSG